ncbi:MAG: helix-turn-helix transcriptional regulator [Treponema sp.]|nr:helix-turn-helix transcriptional regulator [Treponema sp.]
MSPFWKNVNDELQYQGMNIKTLSVITGIPYTTITNGKNRPDSIPSADVAIKISKALNKSLEWLLGESSVLPKTPNNPENSDKTLQELNLYHKYERMISALEMCSVRTQEAFINMSLAISEK